MEIIKKYTFTNNRQIWRVIPTSGDRLVIEDRDTGSREAFFNCIEIKTGKRIFDNYQFKEKFWLGIEDIYKDIIYLYRYLKPDMPQHKGIIAFDINSKNIIWEQPDFSYLFVKDDKLYCYKQRYEGRSFFIADCYTGEILEELGNDGERIKQLREESINQLDYEEYLFPEQFYDGKEMEPLLKNFLTEFKQENLVIGAVEFLPLNSVVFLNTFEPNDEGSLNNIFRCVEFQSGKVIFSEILNKNAHAAVPDSFFMKNNNIFLLEDKTRLLVCSVK
jgi:hypothetical protein